MSYYYLPLSTKDFTFENIFSTESISPYIFYYKRQYGIDYFSKVDGLTANDALLLFPETPKFETPNFVKYILAIDKSEIKVDDIILLDGDIVIYPKTIYLSKDNFKLLFFSERDRKLTIAKSITSLPTKSVKKYLDNFEIIDESLCKEYKSLTIENKIFPSNNIDPQIKIDRRFNSLKGFIYGLTVGIIAEKKPEEIQIKVLLQDLINSFAELKNKTENDKRRLEKQVYKNNQKETALLELNQILRDAENKFFNFYKELNVSNDKKIDNVLRFLIDNLGSDIEAKRFLGYLKLFDKITDSNSFELLVISANKTHISNDPVYCFEVLRNSIQIVSTSGSKSTHAINNSIEDNFKSSIFQLNKFIDESFIKTMRNKRINLNFITYSPGSNQFEQLNNPFLKNDSDVKEYYIIVNTLLSYAKTEKGDSQNEILLSIVENVGSKMTKSKNIRQTHLYKYLNNEIDTYSFENISSIVTKNFVAFIFNPDSIERLEKFLDAKEIKSKWISYSFWCAYNGFANISGNFINPIFESNNSDLQIYLDSILLNFRNQITESINVESPTEYSIIVNGPNEPVLKNNNQKIEEFFEKFIFGKFNLTREGLESSLELTDSESIVSFLKKNFSIKKNDAKKILAAYQDFINAPQFF